MALSVNSNFSENCALPIEERFVLSKEQMLNEIQMSFLMYTFVCVAMMDNFIYIIKTMWKMQRQVNMKS